MGNVQFIAHNERVMICPVQAQSDGDFSRPRGRVGSFSWLSRQRLMAIFYSFKDLPFKTFWTFTFDSDVKIDFAKREINRLNMIFNRRHIGWLWVMEFQENNRVHFHYALTGYLGVDWLRSLWGHGRIHVSEVFSQSGLRKYFTKEVAKTNQKRFMGYCGRWWGVSRSMNKRYSLGVYDDSFMMAIADIRGIKHRYWREDLEGFIDNPYSNFNNWQEYRKTVLKNPKNLL